MFSHLQNENNNNNNNNSSTNFDFCLHFPNNRTVGTFTKYNLPYSFLKQSHDKSHDHSHVNQCSGANDTDEPTIATSHFSTNT